MQHRGLHLAGVHLEVHDVVGHRVLEVERVLFFDGDEDLVSVEVLGVLLVAGVLWQAVAVHLGDVVDHALDGRVGGGHDTCHVRRVLEVELLQDVLLDGGDAVDLAVLHLRLLLEGSKHRRRRVAPRWLLQSNVFSVCSLSSPMPQRRVICTRV